MHLKLGIGLLPENRQTRGAGQRTSDLPECFLRFDEAVCKERTRWMLDKEMENAIVLCKKIQLKANDITAPPCISVRW